MAKKQSQKNTKTRTKKVAAATARRPRVTRQTDIQYFIKILLFFILGTFWVRLINIGIGPFEHLSLPVGLCIGLFLVSYERLQIDRKIEYVILIAATFISFYLPVGITI